MVLVGRWDWTEAGICKIWRRAVVVESSLSLSCTTLAGLVEVESEIMTLSELRSDLAPSAHGVRTFDPRSHHCPARLSELYSDLGDPDHKFCPNSVFDLPTHNRGSFYYLLYLTMANNSGSKEEPSSFITGPEGGRCPTISKNIADWIVPVVDSRNE
ncbi:hypothetical protein C8R44DRAFT_724351 [Mycena epipterygia]|nr:hypothetical protein C8R44DRAFT_724351 [Mycena epipterygia]